MSIAPIRALIETEVSNAYSALATPVKVEFDNVGETPPADASGEFVILTISFEEITVLVACAPDPNIEWIRGNVQIAAYTPRAQGMKRLEELGLVAVQTLVGLGTAAQTFPGIQSASAGPVSGPTPVLSGDSPLALTNVSAAFYARV